MCSSDLPNPKPQTPNPKPQTPNPRSTRYRFVNSSDYHSMGSDCSSNICHESDADTRRIVMPDSRHVTLMATRKEVSPKHMALMSSSNSFIQQPQDHTTLHFIQGQSYYGESSDGLKMHGYGVIMFNEVSYFAGIHS